MTSHRRCARVALALCLALYVLPASAEPGSDVAARDPIVPSQPNKGEPVQIELEVCNLGKTAPTGEFDVRLSVVRDAAGAGAKPLHEETASAESLEPEACASLQFSVTFPDSGGYDLNFEVDPDGATGDANLDNNSAYHHTVAF